MAESRSKVLLGLSLGTFHTTVLVLLLVWLVVRSGGLPDLLDGLSTLAGLGLFAVLWGVTGWSTWHAVRGLDPADRDLGRELARGAFWGGVSGALFLGMLVLALVAARLPDVFDAARSASPGDAAQVLLLLPYLVTAGAVAFAVGAIVGTLFALIDRALLELSRSLAPAYGGSMGAPPPSPVEGKGAG